MDLNLTPSCYCCRRSRPERMDLDAALDELGMLSTVTESRKQFVQERMRTRSESAAILTGNRPLLSSGRNLPAGSSSHSASYHIVHIDPKYVTGVSDLQTPTPPKTELPRTTAEDVVVDPTCVYMSKLGIADTHQDRRTRLRKMCRSENISARNRRISARKRSQQPYEVPGRLSQSFQESDLLSRCAREDVSESKSNTSSPVKSFVSDSLPRSRSLDNLDFSSFFISDYNSESKQELDGVSKRMKNLNVSDS